MPRLGRFIVSAILLCAFAAPVAIADPPGSTTTVSGTLERTHEDTATGPRPITVLSTSAGPQLVHFAPGEPVPPNGAELRLHGRVNGGTMEADSATIIGPTVAVPTTAPADGGDGKTPVASNQGTPLAVGTPRSVAIVVITFAGGAPPAYTDAYLKGVLIGNPDSVSNYFSEQSYGAVSFQGLNDPSGDVYHATIAANGSGCNSTPTPGWTTWGSQAQAAVGASTLARYDHVIYVFNSGRTCGWAGLGYMPGREVYIDNAFQLSVVAHELGHNLGVHHASSLRCIAGGQPVAFSTVTGACTSSEYGDPYDIMGMSATNQQNAFHKLQSGWLGSDRVKTITASGDYTVTPLEQASGVALLLVPHVTGGVIGQDFALDLRQTYGSYFDAFAAGSPATAGIQVRLVQTPGGSPIQTQLIDTTPQTSTFNDAALVPGATFSDSTDHITIQTLSVDPLVGATVRITLGDAPASDTTPPTAVSSLAATVASGPEVTLSYGAAADSGGIAAYRVTRDGAPIATLGSSATSYPDWTPSYGPHTYGITAVDVAGNVGPTATVTVVVPAPPPPTPPTATTPKPGVKTPAAKLEKPATKVKAKIVKGRGSKRRVLLSWRPVAGVHTYLVLRNGHKLTVTRKHELVDNAPPHGRLRYVVRSTG
jgi:Gametolysin peptidase M11